MGKVKLDKPRPNYLEREPVDPKKAMERAREQVLADRKRRARYLMTSAARG